MLIASLNCMQLVFLTNKRYGIHGGRGNTQQRTTKERVNEGRRKKTIIFPEQSALRLRGWSHNEATLANILRFK